MAVDSTVIGRASFVRGKVSGSGDLSIHGRVEGDVTLSGEVVVEASGLVAANISASRIVVRGAVKGDLVAEDALVVEAGAKIVGDLRAPRITIAAGGLVRGHVATGSAPARPRAAARVAEAPVKRVTAAAKPAAPKAVAKAPPPAPSSRSVVGNTRKKGLSLGATLAGARVPPAPVVPVLKKGTKAVSKKAHAKR